MPKAPAEHVAEFLIEFLPGLLPKPADSIVKSAIGTFKDTLGEYLKQPRLRRQLLEAAQGAESDFRAKAKEKFGNDELTQAVASFPLFDRDLFQSALQSLPDHLHEDYLADHLKRCIADDWKGKFAPAELREAVALYLNCLRVRLLKVDGYAGLVARLATLRTDERTEQILAIVKELLELVRELIAKGQAAQTVVSSLFTIPAPVRDFTGREKDLETLKAAFSRGAIITGVTGGGGIGKTELARKLAQEIADDYPAARMELNLRGTDPSPLTPEDAMRRLLEPFYPGQKLPDDPNQLRGLYQQTFAQNKSLLLLDNAADASQVRPLIPPAPSAAIVTSRLHFSLSECGLNPLRLDVLSETDAVLLLRASCGKMKETSEQEALELARLCGRLPLALRVAGSILTDSPNWTAQTLISRLKDERTRLARLKRDSDPNRDVEAVLRLSYDLLDDGLKAKFRQLGVFPAPFLMRSAQAVWGLTEADEADDLLGKLVNRSLVNVTAASPGRVDSGVSIHPSDYSTAALSAGRVDASEASDVSRPAGEGAFSLHNLTRLFGFERLLENEAEAADAIMAHANHFLDSASAADDQYEKGNENILPALSQFRFIYPHLNAAFERLSARQGDPQADRWLSDFPGKCAYVLDLHLPPRQKIPLLEAALAASRRLKDKQDEGIHLGNLGLAYAALGEARKAIEFYEQCLTLHREIGDRRGEGADLGNLGVTYVDLGEARKAIEFYEKQLVIVREIGDRRGEGNALGNLGLAYATLGQARKAIEFYEKQLVIVREIGDRRGEGNALGNLGVAYADLGEARKAIEFYEQALIIDREIGDRRGEGADLGNLGNAYAALGEVRKAIEFYEQCLTLHREIGDRRGEGADLGNLGLAYAALGEARKAIEFYEKRMEIAREIGDRRGEGNALGNLGNAYYALGDARKAIEFYEKRMEIAREIGDRRGEGNALANMGMAYKNLGDKAKAKKLWQEALAIYRAIEDPHVKLVEKWLEGV